MHFTKQDSGRASKTGDKLIFAQKTAKKNLSPQACIVPINPVEFLVFLTGVQTQVAKLMDRL